MSWLIRLALLSLFAVFTPVSAHEGHDHEAEARVAADAQSPRLLYSKSPVEAVAQFDGRGLSIWVDDYASNLPRSGLQVSVKTQGAVLQAQEVEPGLYQVPRELFSGADVDLGIQLRSVDAPVVVDSHFGGKLPLPLIDDETSRDRADWIAIAAAVLLLSLVLLVVLRRRRR